MVKMDEIEKDWLFYLAQPSVLLSDLEHLSIAYQLNLLKQTLSQAEISDRKLNSSNSENAITENVMSECDAALENMELESSRIFRKSKFLDFLSIQIASNLKFNLNLLRISSEMPIKLLARLYRVLVTNTAKASSTLRPLFEQAADKENIFTINPYASYSWLHLNPITIYGIMSYHIWCLQVSLTSCMLPHPFRNLTPVVSGLTEVPDLAFFHDNRVEVGVVLARIHESVAQITEINNIADSLNVARPLPLAFTVDDRGILYTPDVPNVNGETNSNVLSNAILEIAEPLSKNYLSGSLNFVLGRYAFQQQQFTGAQKHFELALVAMQTEKLNYLYEVGTTPKLIQTYLNACRSYTEIPDNLDYFNASSEPYEFVELFCTLLEKNISTITSSELNENNTDYLLFWHQIWQSDSKLENCKLDNHTIEEHLYEILLKDIFKIFTPNLLPNFVYPISLGTRVNLENLSLKLLEKIHVFYMNEKSKVMKSNKFDKCTNIFLSVQKLYTKIHVCNSVERLLTNSFENPLILVTELLLGSSISALEDENEISVVTNDNIYHNDNFYQNTSFLFDHLLGTEFLFDCLICSIEFLSQLPKTNTIYCLHTIWQFITYVLQEGIVLIGSVNNNNQSFNSYTCLDNLRNNYQHLLKTLVNHRLMNTLPSECRSLIHSLKNSVYVSNDLGNTKSSSLSHMENLNHLPNPKSDLNKNPFLINWDPLLNKLLNNGLLCKDLGELTDRSSSPFGTSTDIDMRTISYKTYSGSHNLQQTSAYNCSNYSLQQQQQQSVKPNRLYHDNLTMQLYFKQNSFLICNNQLIRGLLNTVDSNQISSLIDQLLRSGLRPDNMLELNTSWIPILTHLASLELMGSHANMECNVIDPVEFTLSSSLNISCTLSIFIQLIKAATILRHQTFDVSLARILLINCLSNINKIYPIPNGAKSSRSSDPSLWIRAAVRHELLLVDLLEILNPIRINSINCVSHISKISNISRSLNANQVTLNDLKRRAKICLLHAAGLSNHVNTLESRIESMNPIGLSNELICTASCFLLLFKEHEFLMPTLLTSKSSISLPVGSINYRVSCIGSLELIRILLRFHDVLYSLSRSISQNNITLSSLTGSIQLTDNKSGGSKSNLRSRPGILGPGDKCTDPERLKLLIEEFSNLIIDCCSGRTSEDRNWDVDKHRISRSHFTTTPSGRVNMDPVTLYSTIDFLATIDFTTDLFSALDSKFSPSDLDKGNTILSDTTISNNPTSTASSSTGNVSSTNNKKGKSSNLTTNSTSNQSTGSHLLNYFIICVAKMLHLQSTRFDLQIWINLSQYCDRDIIKIQTKQQDTVDISNVSSKPKSRSMKKSRWDTINNMEINSNSPSCNSKLEKHEDVVTFHEILISFLLNDKLWSLDLDSNSSSSHEFYGDILHYSITSGLMTQPDRIDWLGLKAEVEFYQKKYRLALSTYLEIGAFLSEGFMFDISPHLFWKEVIARLVDCCRFLGLLFEAIVLCQFSPDESLIVDAIQIINSIGENVSSANNFNAKPDILEHSNQNSGSESYLNEPTRGACGGFLNRTAYDCPDNLLPYFFNLRIIESLISSALRRGSLSQLNKFRGILNIPELNSNNPEEIQIESRCAQKLGFFKYLSELYLL